MMWGRSQAKPSQEEGEEEMDDNLLPPTETTFFFIDANISLFLLYERKDENNIYRYWTMRRSNLANMVFALFGLVR